MTDQASDEAVTEQSTASQPGMLATLAHRDFTLLWSGQSLSTVGNLMLPIVIAMVVLDRGAGPAGLGVVLALQGIALAVGTALAAALVDRWRRSRVMISTDVVRAVGVVAIAVDPAAMPDPVFITVIVAIGIAEGMFLPAYSALIPRILPERHLQSGNALTSLSQYVAMVAGPGLAGVVIAASGTGPALWINAATFVASLVTLVLIKEYAAMEETKSSEDDAGPLRRGMRDLTEGLRAVWERPWIAASIGMATIVMTFVVAPAFLAAPIEATERLGGASAYGAMFTALGVGSILGAVVSSKIRTQRPGVVAISGIFTIFGSVGSLALLPLPGVLVCWAIAGVGVTIFQVLWMTAVQKDVPDRLLGRVMALDWLGSQGLMPLGYAVAGLVVSAIGTRDMLIAGAVLVLVVAPLPLLVRGGATFQTTRPAEADTVDA